MFSFVKSQDHSCLGADDLYSWSSGFTNKQAKVHTL